MSKAFKWIGPGTFTDRVGARAVEIFPGDKVHEHTVAEEKLAAWVKAGIAEYLGVAANLKDKLTGNEPSEASKRESARRQEAIEQGEAAKRIQSLGRLRTLLASPVFTEAERIRAEHDVATMSDEDLQHAIEGTRIEQEARKSKSAQSITQTTTPDPAAPSDEDLERLTAPAGDGAGPK